jgi:hypothetical protein
MIKFSPDDLALRRATIQERNINCFNRMKEEDEKRKREQEDSLINYKEKYLQVYENCKNDLLKGSALIDFRNGVHRMPLPKSCSEYYPGAVIDSFVSVFGTNNCKDKDSYENDVLRFKWHTARLGFGYSNDFFFTK